VEYGGEIAALGAALGFTFTGVFFTLAGRSVSAPLINRTRLLLAVLLVIGLHWLIQGQLLPQDVELSRWGWLGLSGIIGLSLGDGSLFQALILIGPRLSSLIMALAPVIATLLAWIFLGETLSGQELLGIALVIGGILSVVADRAGNGRQASLRAYMIGLLFALGGATGQAAGAVTSKIGLADNFSPLSAHLMRLLVATVAIWVFATIRGHGTMSFRTLNANRRAARFIGMGTLFGPTIGVWLSLIAFQEIPVGVASTLVGLTPIFMIPIARIVFKESITFRAIIGTVVAVLGTTLLF